MRLCKIKKLAGNNIIIPEMSKCNTYTHLMHPIPADYSSLLGPKTCLILGYDNDTSEVLILPSNLDPHWVDATQLAEMS